MGVVSCVCEPTDWCSSIMVVVPRADRICLDLSRLNESVRWEHHPLCSQRATPTLVFGRFLWRRILPNSLHLSPRLGRFCFNRLPFGITLAPEYFQWRISEILHDVEGVICLMNDILVHGKSKEARLTTHCSAMTLGRRGHIEQKGSVCSHKTESISMVRLLSPQE